MISKKPKKALKKKPASDAKILSTPNELSQFAGRKAIVGGSLSFIPKNGDDRSAGQLVALPARDAAKGILANLRKSAPKLRLYVSREVFNKPKVRFAFLVDAYLAYGLSTVKKGETVAVVGGVESETDRFPIDILVFDAGGLVRTIEQTISGTGSHSFNVDCNDIVQQLKSDHPGVRVVVAEPLSRWNIDTVEYESDVQLNKLSFRPMTAAKAAQERYGFAAATVVAGLAVFAGFTAKGWSGYNDAVARYDVASRDPSVKEQGGVDSNYFNVMNQRRQFMEAPRRQDLLSNKTLDIIKGIGALPQVQIIEIRMPAPAISAPTNRVGVVPNAQDPNSIGPDRVPDVWMKISVPKTPGPALYQAREVVRALIASTGMSIRTASQGWAEENGRRVFMLEGFIHA